MLALVSVLVPIPVALVSIGIGKTSIGFKILPLFTFHYVLKFYTGLWNKFYTSL